MTGFSLSNCQSTFFFFFHKAAEADDETKSSPVEITETLTILNVTGTVILSYSICASPDQGGYLQLDLGLVEYLTDMRKVLG